MNPKAMAVRTGINRGWLEVKQTLTSGQDLFNMLFWPTIALVVMYFMRDATLPGTNFSLGSAAMPGVLGMQVAFAGMIGVSAVLMVEREDGTLLRAKAVPNGMLGYLIGKIVSASFGGVIAVLIVLLPGLLMFDGLTLNIASWITLLWVLAVGLLATLPIGAVFGALTDNPRNLGLIFLPIMGLVAISGIFYPITGMPEWLQFVGQLFPIYWLGLGMRSALLPDVAVAAEIGQSWRHWEMLGVLGLWAVAGLVLAPILLRRMARRESGANMAARRERAMQRVQ